MMNAVRTLSGLTLLLAVAAPAAGQPATANVGVTVTIAAAAKLTVGSTTVSFPNADPDTTPSIPASEGAITISAKTKTAGASTVALTILASSDLRTAGGDIIPITAVTWTASGAGFVAGTLNRTTAQVVAQWTGSGDRSGTQSYRLANSWTYATGTYSTSATYTLTAP